MDGLTVRLEVPCGREEIELLSAGQAVSLSGIVYTGRDRLHRYLFDGGEAPVSLAGAAIYHCGPVVVPAAAGGWRVTAAGPTTSMREEPYMAALIARLGLRAVIGKGGMGAATVAACREHGCIYLQTVGGAAAWLARCVRQVRDVWWLEEFGATEAMWALEVEGFEAIVAIDSRGHSLYAEVEAASRRRLEQLY